MRKTIARKTLVLLLIALLGAVGFQAPAAAWTTSNRYGGHTTGGWGGATHTNAWGGTTTHNWDGATTTHTNVDGGHTTAVPGYGAVHTTPNGAVAYRPPTGTYPGYGPYHPVPYASAAYYHPPVPYYASGCYNCAGAVAVGVAAGAVVATAAHPAAPAPVAVPVATPVVVPAPVVVSASGYVAGASYAALPAGSMLVMRNGVAFYQYGATVFRPVYGPSGVSYSVVAVR